MFADCFKDRLIIEQIEQTIRGSGNEVTEHQVLESVGSYDKIFTKDCRKKPEQVT